ncbi:MAG TPA: hypothetical protein DFR83_01910 [Deltaproteobacteria bacterium]|nr:hypothetical protein [Deltaproteobacteria bacterium]
MKGTTERTGTGSGDGCSVVERRHRAAADIIDLLARDIHDHVELEGAARVGVCIGVGVGVGVGVCIGVGVGVGFLVACGAAGSGGPGRVPACADFAGVRLRVALVQARIGHGESDKQGHDASGTLKVVHGCCSESLFRFRGEPLGVERDRPRPT